jgi:type I restriction enzyme M protein
MISIVTAYHNRKKIFIRTLESFEKRNKENNKDVAKKHFFVSIDEIKANDWDLSINRYKEVVYDEVTYAQPSVIIQDIKNLQEENKQKLLILEELLK